MDKEINNPSILVLLSSYNGEKYIEEQINTILSQKNVNVHLLVRDDGSSDKTCSILERYKLNSKLKWYCGDNVGWRNSFIELAINSPNYDYYAFSDQDDHWEEDKLFVALKCMKYMPVGPNLYMSNLYYWQNGVNKGLSMPKHVRTDIPHSLLFCESFGCTMVFNHQLMDIIKKNPPKLEVAHDFWFFQVASILGHIYYDNNSYILYRQHDNNQLGYDKYFLERNKRRIKNYLNILNVHELDVQAQELLRCYGELMSDDKKEKVSIVANYRNNLIDWFKLLFSSKYTHDRFLTNLGLKFRILIRHI